MPFNTAARTNSGRLMHMSPFSFQSPAKATLMNAMTPRTMKLYHHGEIGTVRKEPVNVQRAREQIRSGRKLLFNK